MILQEKNYVKLRDDKHKYSFLNASLSLEKGLGWSDPDKYLDDSLQGRSPVEMTEAGEGPGPTTTHS